MNPKLESDFNLSLEILNKCINVINEHQSKTKPFHSLYYNIYNQMARCYISQNKLPTSLQFLQKALAHVNNEPRTKDQGPQ